MKKSNSGVSPRRPLAKAAFLTALLTSSAAVQAGDLFSITAIGAGTVTVGANSVVDLIENAVNRSGAFAALGGGAVTAGLSYAGVANAITYTSTGTGQSTITIPSTGFSQAFGTTQQLTDFLKTNGSAEVAKFLKAMSA